MKLLFIIASILIGLCVTYYAKKKGYYNFNVVSEAKNIISNTLLFQAFLIFFLAHTTIIPGLYTLYFSFKWGAFVSLADLKLNVEDQGLMNILSSIATLVAMLLFFFSMTEGVKKAVFGAKRDSLKARAALYFKGVFSILLIYPFVLAFGQSIELIIEFFRVEEGLDQTVVVYLKGLFDYRALYIAFCLSTFTVIPLLEELLFRGFLQGWFYGFLGCRLSIILTSLIFALFHFSLSQGFNNIEILSSLFLLSCFLGFLKEQSNSLWVPIGLHSAFNFVSVMMLSLMR